VTLSLYFAFVAASAAVFLSPGPVVALIFANTQTRGVAGGLATMAGAVTAKTVHMILVVFGLSTFLATAGSTLFWLKWLGAAYLVFLGVRIFLAPVRVPVEKAGASGRSLRRLYGEAVLVAALNPKVLLFYAAFFPLFIRPDAPVAAQLVLLGATFIAVGAVIDSGWTLLGAGARGALAKAGRWPNRISGGVLIAAAAGLALMRK